jgi:hypothetical protein
MKTSTQFLLRRDSQSESLGAHDQDPAVLIVINRAGSVKASLVARSERDEGLPTRISTVIEPLLVRLRHAARRAAIAETKYE